MFENKSHLFCPSPPFSKYSSWISVAFFRLSYGIVSFMHVLTDVFVFTDSIVLSTAFFLLRKQKMSVRWDLDLDPIRFLREHIAS